MRDKIKDQNFFVKKLDYTYQGIDRYEKLLNKVIEMHGADSEGANNGYGILTLFYNQVLNLEYSAGNEIIDMKKHFTHYIKYYTLGWNIDNGYIDLIRTLSLGVLLNVEDREFEKLKRKIIMEGLNDYLVNYLMRFIDSSWDLNSNDFYFKGIYEPIKSIIDENDLDISLKMLKNYLEKQWYNIHNECAWYNSHKSKQDTYYGYWAYEAGAIAKILNLDDTDLKDQQYYPYDLVHFNDK